MPVVVFMGVLDIETSSPVNEANDRVNVMNVYYFKHENLAENLSKISHGSSIHKIVTHPGMIPTGNTYNRGAGNTGYEQPVIGMAIMNFSGAALAISRAYFNMSAYVYHKDLPTFEPNR